MDESSKWASRKFILSIVQLVILVVLPIVYKQLDISETVLATVLGTSTALLAVYTGANVLQKKVESGD